MDLVVLNDAPTALLARILSTRRVIADGQPFVRHRFESLEMRKAADFRIFERRILSYRFGNADGSAANGTTARPGTVEGM